MCFWHSIEAIIPPTDVPYVTGAINLLAVFVAGAAFLLARRTYIATKERESFKLGIDLILKISERFESADMRPRRGRAARALLQKMGRGDTEEDNQDMRFVLNVFEEIGFLLEKKAIDLGTVYTFFSDWVHNYYYATEAIRARQTKQGDPEIWTGFESMFRALKDSEPSAFRALTAEQLRSELEAEAAILDQPI